MTNRRESTWWKRAVFYQVYPRSFKDSNADGIGDLKGIQDKLDYFQELGVDALWISPFFKSPMKDFGYDISDYKDIDPIFGSLEDFRSLLAAAHERGLRIVADLVVNHSSDEHPWFKAARSSRTDSKHDWYIWKPVTGRRPPNNWISLFEQRSAWYSNEATGEWYLATFTRNQPEFNWRNPELREAVYDVTRFWLDLGVDGFRMDVATAYFKDAEFRSNPFSFNLVPNLLQHHIYDRNRPEVFGVFKDFRAIADSYGDRMLIGETHGLDPVLAASCHGSNGDGLHMAFNFDFLNKNWNARQFKKSAEHWYDMLPPSAWPNFTLSNHDQSRHYYRYRSGRHSDERAKVAATMLLCLRGTPFLYYGEEIGMNCESLPRASLRDPLGIATWPLRFGRDPERIPMQWDDSLNAGFSQAKPWLPVNTDYRYKNVLIQKSDPASLWSWYAALLRLRKAQPALVTGSLVWLDAPPAVMAWRRSECRQAEGMHNVEVYLNFSEKSTAINISAGIVLQGTSLSPGKAVSAGGLELGPYGVLIISQS